MRGSHIRRLTEALVVAALLTVGAAPAHANLITNGGFEAGLTGWTTGGSVAIDSTNPHSGSNDAAFGAGGVLFWTVGVPTTVGKSYTVSYWIQSDPVVDLPGAPGSGFYLFSSTFAGISFPNISGASGFAYTPITQTFVATNSVSPLTFFGFRISSGTDLFRLDDVSVELVPEPTTVGLLGAGLLGLAGVLRRRSHS